MPRYFLEVAYDGTAYAGFQVQENANSIQAEAERALETYFRMPFQLTCSSRTDAGVHAEMNYFHFDVSEKWDVQHLDKSLYHLNAILPANIVFRRIFLVPDDFHCRFDALSRTYHYYLYRSKDPFRQGRAFFYPYTLQFELLQESAALVRGHHDFTSFSKRNTQVKHYECTLHESEWALDKNEGWVYRVKGNRFLRGMVRGLVGTMLRVGTGKIGLAEFEDILRAKDQSRVDFSVPAHGLYLKEVTFPSF